MGIVFEKKTCAKTSISKRSCVETGG